MLRQFIEHPQRVWMRQLLFQIHLWTGIILGLYVLIIGLSGSILVVQDEIAFFTHGKLTRAPGVYTRPWAEVPAFTANIHAAYKKVEIDAVYLPTVRTQTYVAIVKAPHLLYVFGDPNTGQVIGQMDPTRYWISWVSQLHVRLLAGRIGLILNGIGAGFLLLLCISGLVIWWPGIKRWTRALKVDFSRGWKRINFDLHSAIGFWPLALFSIWAVTGIYFAWPRQFTAMVNRFSPVRIAAPKVVVPPRASNPEPDLRPAIAQARSLSPQGKLAAIFLPDDADDPLTILMARGERHDFTNMDYLYFDPASGKQLMVWHRGQADTWGSRLILLLGPLHFGTYWGLGVKIVWALAGLGLPLLFLTGILMYWNRVLHRKWKQLRKGSEKLGPPVKTPAEAVSRASTSWQ